MLEPAGAGSVAIDFVFFLHSPLLEVERENLSISIVKSVQVTGGLKYNTYIMMLLTTVAVMLHQFTTLIA